MGVTVVGVCTGSAAAQASTASPAASPDVASIRSRAALVPGDVGTSAPATCDVACCRVSPSTYLIAFQLTPDIDREIASATTPGGGMTFDHDLPAHPGQQQSAVPALVNS